MKGFPQSASGLAHSKTPRESKAVRNRRQLLECGCLLPLFKSDQRNYCGTALRDRAQLHLADPQLQGFARDAEKMIGGVRQGDIQFSGVGRCRGERLSV